MSTELQWTDCQGVWKAVSHGGQFDWVWKIIERLDGTFLSYNLESRPTVFQTFDQAKQWCNEQERKYVEACKRSEEIKAALEEAWRDE